MKGLDTEGMNVGAPLTIRTWMDERVDPLALDPSDVQIADVAHALSRQCRYNGHNDGFLSVARHSLWVADTLALWGFNTDTELWGLLHDSAEAYLGDVPRPLKHNPAMEFFLVAEAKAEEVIAGVFSLPYPIPGIVREADKYVLTNVELSEGGARETYFGSYMADEAEFIARFESLNERRWSE